MKIEYCRDGRGALVGLGVSGDPGGGATRRGSAGVSPSLEPAALGSRGPVGLGSRLGGKGSSVHIENRVVE